MICRVRRVLRSQRGASRPVVIALIVIVILAGIAAVPIIKDIQAEAGENACSLAMETARRNIKNDFMMNYSNVAPTAKDARDIATYALVGRDSVCPSGGTVYVVENSNSSGTRYDLFCGMHDPDLKRRTRLNASYVLYQIDVALAEAAKAGQSVPETVTVTLHGKELTAQLVDKDQEIKHGTDNTKGLDGTVIYFSVAGHGEFHPEEDAHLREGDVCYFVYADENYCANWSYQKSWTGDSYT